MYVFTRRVESYFDVRMPEAPFLRDCSHPEGREGFWKCVEMNLIVYINVGCSGKGYYLKIQGKLCPFFRRIFLKKN